MSALMNGHMRPAHTITVGSVVMPPPRELRLWMRRTLAEKGLPESALYLTVTEITEGAPDKGGRWLIITGRQAPEWALRVSHFRFRVRPDTPWAVVSRVQEGSR